MRVDATVATMNNPRETTMAKTMYAMSGLSMSRNKMSPQRKSMRAICKRNGSQPIISGTFQLARPLRRKCLKCILS